MTVRIFYKTRIWTQTHVRQRQFGASSTFFWEHRTLSLFLDVQLLLGSAHGRVEFFCSILRQWFVLHHQWAPFCIVHSNPSSYVVIVPSFLRTSLRFWRSTSFTCASFVFLAVCNDPISSSLTLAVAFGFVICSAIQYTRISSSTSLFSYSFSDSVRGCLDIGFAALWYFPGLWTISKSNSISLSLHHAKRPVDLFKSNIHRSA